MSITASSAARSRSTRSGSVTPKTARQITSNVSARIRSRIGNSSPTFHRPISAAATSPITSRKAFTAEPWNGGNRSLRWRRCSGPSRTSTEFWPSTGERGELASPASRPDWSPVNIPLISSGSAT